jgi:hypothetical protein
MDGDLTPMEIMDREIRSAMFAPPVDDSEWYTLKVKLKEQPDDKKTHWVNLTSVIGKENIFDIRPLLHMTVRDAIEYVDQQKG